MESYYTDIINIAVSIFLFAAPYIGWELRKKAQRNRELLAHIAEQDIKIAVLEERTTNQKRELK